MKKTLCVTVVCIILTVFLGACDKSAITNPTPAYTVTYNGNGNTGGSVPIDAATYEQAQTVTVLGNTGNLEKTGYSFEGWNTQANGSGTTYSQGNTFTMGALNVTLYAKWTANWTGTKQLGAPGVNTYAADVAVDASGNVYVTGFTYGELDGNSLMGNTDYFLTMYDSSVNKVRTKQLGSDYRVSNAYGVATDASGNVYVTGTTTGNLDGNTLMGNTDFFVTKYDSEGNKQ